jgi:ABC-2 type transport system ATP-binding protein
VLVLDEPAYGLDPEGIAWLRGLLRDLAGEGRTVLISSHVLAEVAQTADHVVIISAGRSRFAGPLSGLTDGGVSLEAAFLRLTGPADPADPAGPADDPAPAGAR